MRTKRSASAQMLSCGACGQLPHPQRSRLTLAKLMVVFPVEFALHALIMATHPPLVVAVLLLALSTTVLVVWVFEPSAMRLMTAWLHAPGLRERRTLHAAESLWRLRITLQDEPGSLERVTRELAASNVSILTLHVHPLEVGVLDEIVVAAATHVSEDDLREAVRRAGASPMIVAPTTAQSLADGPTRALELAAQVSQHPETLPDAVAELLGAQIMTDTIMMTPAPHDPDVQSATLRVPSPWSGLFAFTRPDSAFTPAEQARAVRLAQIAEASTLSRPGAIRPPASMSPARPSGTALTARRTR